MRRACLRDRLSMIAGPVATSRVLPGTLRVVDRLECVAVGLLLAQMGPHRLGITILGEGPVCTRCVGYAVDPVAAVALAQEPAAERRVSRPIGVNLVDHL